MGAALATHPGKLSAGARLALLGMARYALDAPTDRTQAAMYWGGQDKLCLSLGLAPTPTRLRAMRRAVHELVEAGLVELVEPSSRYRAAVYQLRLEPGDNPGDNYPFRTPPPGG
jgi:hypothetical protein